MPATLIWPRQSIGGSCQSGNMAALLNSLVFVFKISFLPKYRVKYYDYHYCKVMHWVVMQLVCIAGYFLNVKCNLPHDIFV